MVVGIETNGVMFFATSPSGTGLLGITGSWSNFRCDLAAANEREKGFVRFFLLCIILGHLHICPCLFVLFLVFYLLVISVALLSGTVTFGGGF